MSTTYSSSLASSTASGPEIDAEWMKFMSRITRQLNCDTVDDDTISDDASDTTADVNMHSATTQILAYSGGGNSDYTSSKLQIKPKKSCISKKTQRRSYSFIDNSSMTVADDESVSVSVSTKTTTTTADVDVPVVSEIRKRFTPIYISTKTKIAYLNQPVNIYDIFWKIPVQHYYERKEGVIKKQIKFQTTDPSVVASIKDKLQQQPRCYDEYIIEHIDNPTGRIPYKDQRKVSIGLCKKELTGGNHKKKRAFFNCFVVILRINSGIAPP